MKKEISDKSKNGSEFLWYSGSGMTGPERNALEKDLQRDPFAAEAAEGFELADPEEAKDDLSDLGIRLRKRTSDKRRRTYYYSIAASVAVLMILSSVKLFIDRNKPETPAAKAFQEITRIDIPASEGIAEPAPGRKSDRAEPGQKPKTAVTDRKKVAAQESARAPQQDLTATQTPVKESEPLAARRIDAGEPAPEYSRAAGAAVASAPMPLGGSKREVISEEAVSTMNDSARDIISFPVDSSENKTVKNRVTTPSEPLCGKREFDRYAAENIRVPSDQKAGAEKIVVIEFIVSQTGEFGEFKVTRSPAKEYSAEAQRLIKEGPSWKPAVVGGRSVESKVRLRIVFKR